MRNLKTLIVIFLLTISSCNTPIYNFIDSKQRIGVDFTKGKWLLNELDCPKTNREAITFETKKFFKNHLQDRFFYIEDVRGLLVAKKIPLNPSTIILQELKNGTGYDYFINISAKKNRNDLGSIGFYETKNPTNGKNEGEVFLEIYDLNLLQIIYSAHVVGCEKEDVPLPFDTNKSDKLIDNISFHKNSKTLMIGSLKKILKDLKKKSIKIPKT